MTVLNKKLTKTQMLVYLESGDCPNCGSEKMERITEWYDSDTTMVKIIKCPDCGLALEENWKLYDLNIDEG